MGDDEGGPAAQFRAVTGCTNAVEATQYLEMCNGNLELAVNLYYQQLQPSSSTAAAKDSDNGYISESGHSNASGLAERRSTVVTRRAALRQEASSSSNANNSQDDLLGVNNGDVRAPILPVRGAIIEQTFAQQYNRQNGRFTSSVFDMARDFRAETEERLAILQNKQSTSDPAEAKRMTLQALFRPPIDIMSSGGWDAVRTEAQQRGHWLLVNVQDDLEFACQALNRDVWSNASVKELLRSNFVFWQVHKDSADGNRVGNYYRVQVYPAVFIVDPRTGEQLTVIRAKDAMSFCDQLTTFLDLYPDFMTRDRQLTAQPSFTDLLQSTSKQDCKRIQHTDCLSTVQAPRKRVHISVEQDETMDSDSTPKKARECKSFSISEKSDIESIIDGGSKLTTVDRDEWMKYIGEPDGCGSRILLSLRLPDGNRQLVDVEDTTTLKAIFILVAGLGFYPCDHQLVLDYPKRIYTEEDHYRTLRELNFSKRELIHVERK